MPRVREFVLLAQGEAAELRPFIESGVLDRILQFGELGYLELFFSNDLLNEDQTEVVTKLSEMDRRIQNEGGKPWPGQVSVLQHINWSNRTAAFAFLQNPAWFAIFLRVALVVAFAVFVGSVLIFGLLPTLGMAWRVFKALLEPLAGLLGLSVPELLGVSAALVLGGTLVFRGFR